MILAGQRRGRYCPRLILELNDFMGKFRCGAVFAACLTLAVSSYGQGVPGTPQPDTNTPALPALPGAVPDATVPPQPAVTDPIAAPETAAPVAKPKPKKKPAPPALPSVRGTVSKLDNVAMTLTVDAKGKEETFKISSKTHTFADGKPAILSDGKPGENVTVEYQTGKDKTREALMVRFGGAAAATSVVEKADKEKTEKAPGTAVKKPIKKKAPAKSKKKPAAAGTNAPAITPDAAPLNNPVTPLPEQPAPTPTPGLPGGAAPTPK
jgi:hypothetical protein